MDLPSLTQVRTFWPDVAGPFDEIVPHGCRLARTEDEWRAGATRRRRIELAPEPGAPDLDDLMEEARDDAFRHGWTPHDDGRFELEGVLLTISEAEGRLAVEFLQPWPADHGPPVETSEMFQNLVRRLLRLGGDPVRLEKRVVVSPTEIMTAEVLEEAVEMPSEEQPAGRFDELGFSFNGKAWVSRELTASHEITAHVRRKGNAVRVSMRKVRRAN